MFIMLNNLVICLKKTLFTGDLSKWKINPKAKGNMEEMFMYSPLENNPPKWYYKYK